MKALTSSLLLVGLAACSLSLSAFAQDNAIQVEQAAPPAEGALTIADTQPMSANAATNPYTSPTGGEAPNIISPAMNPDTSTSGSGKRPQNNQQPGSMPSGPQSTNMSGDNSGTQMSGQSPAGAPVPTQMAPQQQGYPTTPQGVMQGQPAPMGTPQQQQPMPSGAQAGPVTNPDGTQSIGGAPAQGMQIVPQQNVKQPGP